MHPGAVILGYEMDPENFELAQVNCRNFDKVTIFNNAIWTEKSIVEYNKDIRTDAFSINKELHTGSGINAVSIADIINDNKLTSIDFLKMDIEGAEIEIFKADISWLQKVLSLNIEFHNVSDVGLKRYVNLLQDNGFNAWKSKQHWCAIEAVKI